MDPVSSATSSLAHYQRLLEVANNALAEGYITPEVVSAQELATAQLEAQTKIFKESLAAETAVLDLLA